jgi:predicted peptidase
MFRHIGIGLLLAASLTTAVGVRAGAQTNQQPETFEAKITKTVTGRYLLYLPKDYKADRRHPWPLILFLHGSGERGSDLEKVKTHGPPKLVAQGKDFPFIIVSPQCPDGQWWDPDILMGLLSDVTKKYVVDKDRIYLTGLSMGGFGTWTLGAEHPELFAAIAPICGQGDTSKAAALKDMPIWAFHGGKDPVVAIKGDQDMVDAVKAAGGDVKFTIYPDAGHDAWTETYDNPDLYQWFLQHKRHKGTTSTGTETSSHN